MSASIPAIFKRRAQGVKKESAKQAGAVGSIRLLARFMLDQRRLFFMAILMLVLEAFTAVQLPLLTGFVVNYIQQRLQQLRGFAVSPPVSPLETLHLPTFINNDVDVVILITIAYIVLTMVNSLGDSLAEIYLARGGRRLGYNLRVGLYAHLQKLSLAFHDQRRTGDILTRVTSDVAALEDFIISSLSDFTGSVLLIGFILFILVNRAPHVAVVAAFVIPVMALISSYFTKRIKAASKELRASEGELASAAQEMLASIRVIQTYGLGSYEQEMFSDQSQKAMNTALKSAGLQARFSWLVSVLGAVSKAAVIWMVVWLIFREPLTADLGLIVVSIAYIEDMFKPTKRIIQEWNTLAKLYASLDRIADLLDRKPAVQDLPGAVPAPPLKGQIEFRNVSFAYQPLSSGSSDGAQPRLALKNLDFKIEPGQVLAVVGHTGAGKSTIVQLLPRLYDPLDGQVLIDGHDIREFTLDSLRAQMSMVLQETILFSGSVVENIAYGRPDATWGEILTAARQANAQEFIERMPEGYYTLLGERGANLSGGQRQRLAIARAFIRNTPILILDEPSTGLDAESTDLVLRALRELMKGKTTVIISHELNLIRNADKIVVIKNGEIEQIGTHESLLESGGLYATLYMKQYGASAARASLEAEGMPALEADAAELRAEDGAWGASLDDVYLDLPNSPSMLNKLPALGMAFDAEKMLDLLQATLFGASDPLYRIESCKPGKALYLPENVCNLQYELKVKEVKTGESSKYVINARLFQSLQDSENYRSEFLASLAAQMRGRPEIAPFVNPVAVLEDLNMALSVFPIDGLLPPLIGASSRDRMIEIFHDTVPEVLSGSMEIENLRIEFAHYGRFRHCVLRYILEGKLTEGAAAFGEAESSSSAAATQQIIYGKVDADNYGALTIPVMTALLERTGSNPKAYRFRIPRPLGFLPDLKLLLIENLPGNARMKDLLLSRLCGNHADQEEHATLEGALESCALILTALHGSKIKLGRRRTFNDDVDSLREELELMLQVFPSLGGQIQAWLDEVVEFAGGSSPMALCFCHGDFTYSQIIFQGKEIGLLDFDSVCQAEPAVDLGQFLAYQRMVICKEQNPEAPMESEEVERLYELFLSTYVSAAGEWLEDVDQLRNRVMAYEMISLMRLAVHSWAKLKGARLYHTVNILKERMSCLARVS